MRLGRSQYNEQGHKSCPECNRKRGEHVFYPPRAFNYHGTRFDQFGHPFLQSWCIACREEQTGHTWDSDACVQGVLADGSTVAWLAWPEGERPSRVASKSVPPPKFSSDGSYSEGDRFITSLWGVCEVVAVEGRRITIRYGEGVTRELSLQ